MSVQQDAVDHIVNHFHGHVAHVGKGGRGADIHPAQILRQFRRLGGEKQQILGGDAGVHELIISAHPLAESIGSNACGQTDPQLDGGLYLQHGAASPPFCANSGPVIPRSGCLWAG